MDKERKKQKKQNIVIEVQTKQSDYNENKTEHYSAQKEQQDIKNEKCIKSDKYIETGVQCGFCQRWFHFQCEGTSKENVMREYPEEMHYICEKDKINH